MAVVGQKGFEPLKEVTFEVTASAVPPLSHIFDLGRFLSIPPQIMVPPMGFEPIASRLKVWCATIALRKHIQMPTLLQPAICNGGGL